MMCDNPILSTSHKMKCKRRGKHRENSFCCSGDRCKFCCSIVDDVICDTIVNLSICGRLVQIDVALGSQGGECSVWSSVRSFSIAIVDDVCNLM